MRLAFGVALGVSLALLGAPRAAAQTGNDLFQQALVKERADGDVQGAIRIYERIVREFAGDRALAARALVQLGGCHERLGSEDAQRAYRRVLQDYADQTEMVREARARLAAIGSGAASPGPRAGDGGVTVREIRFDGLERTPNALLSPDGQKMAYGQQTPRGAGLRVRTLASGEDVVLVDSAPRGLTGWRWSPDGSQIVYGIVAGDSSELRVVGASGGPPRVLWPTPAGALATPLDWSLAGNRILVGVLNPQWTVELVVISASGAVPRTLVQLGRYPAVEIFGRFSPDGTLIAGLQTGNIVVWSADGREEVRVTTDYDPEQWPFWSPDGRFLLFTSDRSGDRDVWAVPMRGAEPTGPPVRVKAGLGRRAMPTGVTAAGGLTFVTYGEGAPGDLFVVNVDSAEGAPARGFRPVARYPTQHSQPRWAPDRSRFAYTSRKGEARWPSIYVGLGTGQQDLELPMQGHYPTNVEWGRDGASLIFPGFRVQDGRVGIFRLSLQNTEIEPLHLGDPPGRGNRGVFVNIVWLPAAGRYFVQQLAGPRRFHFYALEADGTGLRRTADSVPTNSWAWPSPDGLHVAFLGNRTLNVLQLDGAATQLLAEWQGADWYDVLAPGWSPDGRMVAWSERRTLKALDTRSGTTTVLVEAETGSEIVAPPTWSSDGTQVAYVVRDTATGASSRADEVWLVPSSGGSPRRIALAPESHPRLRLEAWLSNGTLAAGGSQRPSGAGTTYRHWLMEGFLPQGAGAPHQ